MWLRTLSFIDCCVQKYKQKKALVCRNGKWKIQNELPKSGKTQFKQAKIKRRNEIRIKCPIEKRWRGLKAGRDGGVLSLAPGQGGIMLGNQPSASPPRSYQLHCKTRRRRRHHVGRQFDVEFRIQLVENGPKICHCRHL